MDGDALDVGCRCYIDRATRCDVIDGSLHCGEGIESEQVILLWRARGETYRGASWGVSGIDVGPKRCVCRREHFDRPLPGCWMAVRVGKGECNNAVTDVAEGELLRLHCQVGRSGNESGTC